jgi:hypothetical protein
MCLLVIWCPYVTGLSSVGCAPLTVGSRTKQQRCRVSACDVVTGSSWTCLKRVATVDCSRQLSWMSLLHLIHGFSSYSTGVGLQGTAVLVDRLLVQMICRYLSVRVASAVASDIVLVI